MEKKCLKCGTNIEIKDRFELDEDASDAVRYVAPCATCKTPTH